MSKFNSTNTIITSNKCGAPAYAMEDKLKLTSMVLTSMFAEKKYYGDNTLDLINIAKTVDGYFLHKLAIYARKEFHMRSVSHALVAIVANREDTKKYIRETVRGVVERVDDITEILACYLTMFGKPIPNGLKRALGSQMNRFDEYQFAKYNGSKKNVKLKDILKITHPNPINEKMSVLFKKILDDELDTPYTWEVELSKGGNNAIVWENLIDSGKIGYMAMLRNLRNMITCNPYNLYKVFEKLSDREEVLKSKQLPFRFFSAYRTLQNEHVVSKNNEVYGILETAIEHSVKNMVKMRGRTLIAIDVSASMNSRISERSDVICSDIARIMGSLANYMCDFAEIVTFDTKLMKINFPIDGKIIKNAFSIPVTGGGTNISLPISYALDNSLHFDRLIMLSDNEINRGYTRRCQSYADEYRKNVNPNLWIHAIDLQGYGTQQFIGEKTNIIAGWSEKVLEFIFLSEYGISNIVDTIQNY